ncbi:unnamed protein product [Enterobius vermicularis]|uniref:Short-chain dehydrogenase/reductase family 16C member 6 n=1 Tax=Enterobius vermicularis TaxID=51028 RepID=A0A0N4UUH6_ENTVE|nr:unnamed protein product [Enterobius vermicularis]
MIDTLITLGKLILVTIIDAIKALFPTGYLPRKSVEDQIVLITGAGSGIGRIMAVEFAKLKAQLVLWDINKEANEKTKELIESIGVHAYTVNLAKRDEIYAAAEKVKSEVGNVDILVNNAGIVTGKKLFDCPDEMMELTMVVNCTSHFFTTKAFLPHMVETDHGHIVTIASMAGIIGTAGMVDYCASKFGAVGFSLSLASEMLLMRKNGVHVTTVCPFFISTGMFHGAATKSPNLLPIMSPEYVVEQVLEAVLTDKELILMPRFCYFAVFLARLVYRVELIQFFLLKSKFFCLKAELLLTALSVGILFALQYRLSFIAQSSLLELYKGLGVRNGRK